jgi:hypothetical protein
MRFVVSRKISACGSCTGTSSSVNFFACETHEITPWIEGCAMASAVLVACISPEAWV